MGLLVLVGSLSVSASAVDTPMGGNWYGVNNGWEFDVNDPVSPPGLPQFAAQVQAPAVGTGTAVRPAEVSVAPATAHGAIRVAKGVFFDAGANFQGFPGSAVAAQLNQTFTLSNTTTETFAAGNGPGSLTWCPPQGNPGAQTCTDPSQATVGNGRIVYTAGENQFGGSFNMLRASVGAYSSVIQATPVFKHNHAANTQIQIWPVGPSDPVTPSNPLGAHFYLQQQQAGKQTSNPVLYVATTAPSHPTNCTACTGAIKTLGLITGTGAVPQPNLFSGFAMTTGMVTMSDSVLGPTNTGTRTVVISTGSDNRTSMGLVGSVNLVAGGVSYSAPNQPVGRRGVLRMQLPEPSSLMGLAAALGGLFLLHARSKQN
jgi:hypothetical protein